MWKGTPSEGGSKKSGLCVIEGSPNLCRFFDLPSFEDNLSLSFSPSRVTRRSFSLINSLPMPESDEILDLETSEVDHGDDGPEETNPSSKNLLRGDSRLASSIEKILRHSSLNDMRGPCSLT